MVPILENIQRVPRQPTLETLRLINRLGIRNHLALSGASVLGVVLV